MARIDDIISKARTLMNDTGSSSYYTGDTNCLSWANQCQSELAAAKLFLKEATLGVTSGTGTVDLGSTYSDFVALAGLWWDDTDNKLSAVDSRTRMESLRQDFSTGSTVYGYYLEGDTLYWIPVPDTTDASAIRCAYYYAPDDMDTSTNTAPITPAAHDDVYVYYCAWMAYLRERTTPNNLADYYRSLYERAKFRLVSSYMPPMRKRSYR